MAGLVLSLKPNEKFLVNGALLENGPKRGQICIVDDNVNVLRMSDAIHPDQATTPIKRIYYAAQLILSGDNDPIETKPDLNSGLVALAHVFDGTDYLKNVSKARIALDNDRFYSVMCALKPLLDLEETMLAQPSVSFIDADVEPQLAAVG